MSQALHNTTTQHTHRTTERHKQTKKNDQNVALCNVQLFADKCFAAAAELCMGHQPLCVSLFSPLTVEQKSSACPKRHGTYIRHIFTFLERRSLSRWRTRLEAKQLCTARRQTTNLYTWGSCMSTEPKRRFCVR